MELSYISRGNFPSSKNKKTHFLSTSSKNKKIVSKKSYYIFPYFGKWDFLALIFSQNKEGRGWNNWGGWEIFQILIGGGRGGLE